MTPFGFAFSASQKLIVSEANGATANQGSASSYSLNTSGVVTAVTSKLMSQQSAPCWVAIANGYAYMTNAGTNNITAYKVGTDGALTLQQNGVSGATGGHPTDVSVTEDNAYLYTLNSTDHTLSTFSISATDGTLSKKADVQSVPVNAVGLVAR
jgi:6-phosphogluconolactonase (cycloisomerase 2 family)